MSEEQTTRKPRGATRKQRQYGVQTDEVREIIQQNPKNVFGKTVYDALKKSGVSLASVLRETGLHRGRFYNILTLNEKLTSTEFEIIFRIAGLFELNEAELLALYLQSHDHYQSADYRGEYAMREYAGTPLAQMGAAFVMLWEGIVHSPYFEADTMLEQSGMALRSVELLESFLQLSITDQVKLVNTAKAWAPIQKGDVDPHERTLNQERLQKPQRS